MSAVWPVTLFLCGYLIATVVGFATFFISETLMWVSIFTAMPVVFGLLAYVYLVRIGCGVSDARKRMVGLILFWIALSFALDALTYIGIIPAVSGGHANWRFFIDQSPWIWLSYMALIASGVAAVFVFERRRASPRG
jgi:hypothetical protein